MAGYETIIMAAAAVIGAGTSAVSASQSRSNIRYQKAKQEEQISEEKRMLADTFGAQSKEYTESREFYSQLAKDPTKSSVWPGYIEKLEAERGSSEQKIKDLYRRKGDTGGPLERALLDLQSEYDKNVETTIMGLKNQAEEKLVSLKTPVLGVPERYQAVDRNVNLTGLERLASGSGMLGGYLYGLERKEKEKRAAAASTLSGDGTSQLFSQQFKGSMLPSDWEENLLTEEGDNSWNN